MPLQSIRCTLSANSHYLAMKPPRNPQDQRRFVEATQWLRPVTRWAARFSLAAPQWIPGVLRNAPLRLTSLILSGYHRVLR
jgi:hypothetical protein